MTRSELIGRIARKHPGFVERDVELAVKMMLDQMAARLAGGGRIEIRGFGSFTVRFRPARIGRNPRTGTVVSLSARYAPHFRPGRGCANASITSARIESQSCAIVAMMSATPIAMLTPIPTHLPRPDSGWVVSVDTAASVLPWGMSWRPSRFMRLR